MIELVVFDLDNTLAGHGKPIDDLTLRQIKILEDKDIKVAICSGKTVYYLNGLLRQLQLKNPIIVGENGTEIQFGIDLPPKTFSLVEISKEKLDRLAWFESEIKKMFDNQLWFQHNRYTVSPFPRTEEEYQMIEDFIFENKDKLEGLKIYKHEDCFDVVPNEINKKAGLEKVLEILNLTPAEIIAVGDSENDYPMFELAGLSIGVCVKDETKVDINFKNINDAMEYILKLIENQL